MFFLRSWERSLGRAGGLVRRERASNGQGASYPLHRKHGRTRENCPSTVEGRCPSRWGLFLLLPFLSLMPVGRDRHAAPRQLGVGGGDLLGGLLAHEAPAAVPGELLAGVSQH